MKKFITLLLTICVLVIYANDSTLTVKRVYDDVKADIQQMGARLEGPTGHVYELYVYQYRVMGIAHACLMLFISTVGICLLYWNVKKAEWRDIKWNRHTIFTIIGTLLTFVSFILTVSFFVDGIFTKIINPEYFAVQEILKTFTQ